MPYYAIKKCALEERMREQDKERINERYNRRLAKWDHDIRTLASGTESHRDIRFRILRELGVSPGCSVLDIGCGFGDFYRYLSDNACNVQYVGYDINPKLIGIAKVKYPNAEFSVKDIQIESFPSFDFIVSTSTFNLTLKEEENYSFIKEVLKICFEHAKRGVAVDFLTTYSEFEVQDAFYYKPEKVFTIAKKITKRVCLRHDYPLFEFCVYLYPDFKGWRTKHEDN